VPVTLPAATCTHPTPLSLLLRLLMMALRLLIQMMRVWVRVAGVWLLGRGVHLLLGSRVCRALTQRNWMEQVME
jgi:uncharacterized membrane protein YgdD (TMEM256/DUF423 family)